jgi:uncharacterized lipoprotein YmbA
MRRATSRWLMLMLLLLLLFPAACASPNPDFYTLAAVPGTVAHIAARSVELRRIGLAGYLDRPEIVRSSASYRLRVASNERWGEPMGSMLERVFTDDLVQRLPDTAVFSESGAISTNPDLVLEVEVQRFDADASGAVVLLAQVAIRHGDERQAARARTLRLTALPVSPSTDAYVAAMSRTLADLADQVVTLMGGHPPRPAPDSVSAPPGAPKHKPATQGG